MGLQGLNVDRKNLSRGDVLYAVTLAHVRVSCFMEDFAESSPTDQIVDALNPKTSVIQNNFDTLFEAIWVLLYCSLFGYCSLYKPPFKVRSL